MKTPGHGLPEGVILKVWLAAGKPMPKFRPDGTASVRCIFAEKHKHNDRNPSAWIDRKSNLYGCHCLNKPLTAKELAGELGVDWRAIVEQVFLPYLVGRSSAQKGNMTRGQSTVTPEEVRESLEVARKYTESGQSQNDAARDYLRERELGNALDGGLAALLPPDANGLPEAVGHQARKDFRIAVPTWSLTTGKLTALVLRSCAQSDGQGSKIRTIGPSGKTAFCNESALQLIRGEEGAPDRILLLEGLTDFLAAASALSSTDWALMAFPGVSTAATFFSSENGSPPAPWIEGRAFYVGFDQDEAGKKASAKVAEALGKHPKVTLRRVKWPDGVKDAAQLLKTQGSEALATAVETAEEVVTPKMRFVSIATSGDELLAAEIARPASLLGDGLLTQGALALLFGCPGVSKTWAALQLAHAIAAGKGEWFGLATGRGRVGYMSLELPDFYLQQRLRAISTSGESLTDLRLVYRPDLKGPVDLERDIPALMEWCKADNLALLIIDPLSRAHRADENSAQEMSGVLGGLENLCHETSTGVLLPHHERKTISGNRSGASSKSELDLLRGTSRLQSDPTLIMHLAEYLGSLRLTFPKPNLAPEPEPIYLIRTEAGPLVVGERPLDASEAKTRRKEAVVGFLNDHPGERFTTEQLMEMTSPGVQERTFRIYLRELEEEGRIKSLGANRNRKWSAVCGSGLGQDQEEVPF